MALLLDQLEADWRRIAEDPRSACHLADICRQAGVADLGALPTWSRTAHRDDVDPVLLELACRGRAGDALAALTLLHLLWPGVLGLVRRWRAIGDLEERASAAVNAVYARICTYPVERRPRAVAANVLLDAAKELRREAQQTCTEPVGLRPVEDVADNRQASAAAEELAAILDEAVDTGLISPDEARLIAATRIGGRSLTDLEPGTRLRTLQRRRQSAEQRLAAAA